MSQCASVKYMVSIITVNYNGWRDTCELLASLKEVETYPSYEVIVVDNASRDNDARRIREAHPEARVVSCGRNLGFAGGNNVGCKYAQGDYLFFLNNDMIIRKPVLAALVRRMSDKKVGGVSPCIRYFYEPERLQYYGYTDMTRYTLRHTIAPFSPSRMGEYMLPKETDVLHGGAMMVRREVLETVGKMSEAYFLFFEEFDWSLRMRKAGYTLYYEPASEVYHKESASIPRATPFREYYLTRARMLYARRNTGGLHRFVTCSYLSGVVLPQKFLLFLIKGRPDLSWAIFRGTFSGLFKRSVAG